MKTIQIILFCIICFTFGYSDSVCAQETITHERSINGQSYVYTSIGRMYNKKNYLDTVVEPYCEHTSAEAITSPGDIFDKVFSPKRKEELKGESLSFTIFWDSSGNAIEIYFWREDDYKITLKEVYALEKGLLKDFKLKMINTCSEKKYYRRHHRYKWR